jgi:hypothetical protein
MNEQIHSAGSCPMVREVKPTSWEKLSSCQMAHLFLVVCSASDIWNASFMCLLRAANANLMNKLWGVGEIARDTEGMRTSQTHEPAQKHQAPFKAEEGPGEQWT